MMDTPNRRDSTAGSSRWATLSGRCTAWILGGGMLSFHVGLYLLSTTALLSWNVLTAPADMWTGDLLRRWGAVLLFHAIAIGAGWTVWRLMAAGRDEDPASPMRPLAASSKSAAAAPMERWFVPRATAEPLSAVREEERAGDSWRSGVARMTRGVVETASNAWSSRWPSPSEHQPERRQRDGAASWPAGANANRADDVQFVSRFTPSFDPETGEPVNGPGGARDVVLDVDGVRVRRERAAEGKGPTANGAAEARRNWVEEATKIRLTPTEGHPSAGHGPNGAKRESDPPTEPHDATPPAR
ncbi:MAG: hypothetical protein ACR2OO_08265 [Thermomicrobiales bacterium]